MAAPLTIWQTLLAWGVLIVFIYAWIKINEYIHRAPAEKPKA